MILLIDNYDSFVYNLYQLLAEKNEVCVVKNDKISLAQIDALAPTHLVLSPGPGRPKDAGILEEAVTAFAGKLPILGVCLGHQAICEAFGGKITYARTPMHGKAENVCRCGTSPLFTGLPETFTAARYHSLAAETATLPKSLHITAASADGEIMALEHVGYNVFGVQFHPESILSSGGAQIVENFIGLRGGIKSRQLKAGGRWQEQESDWQ